METVATWFGYRKPDPRQQMRKTKRLMESNLRELARCEVILKKREKYTIGLVKEKSRDLNDSNLKNVAREGLHTFAFEVVRIRKSIDRLATCRAALNFVQNGVELDVTVHKVENAIAVAVNTMRTKDATKDSADITRATEIAQRLATEQLKAEVIEGLVLDALPEENTGIDAEDSSIDQLLSEILDDSMATSKVPTTAPALKTPAATAPKEEEEEEEEEKEVQEDDQLETAQALMGELDHRLEALRS